MWNRPRTFFAHTPYILSLNIFLLLFILFWCVSPAMPVCTCVWRIVPLCTHVWRIVPVYTRVWRIVPLCTHVWRSRLCEHTWWASFTVTNLYSIAPFFRFLFNSVESVSFVIFKKRKYEQFKEFLQFLEIYVITILVRKILTFKKFWCVKM